MPYELLRDVLRTDDAAGRSRRRCLLFPVSVTVHAVGALAYLIIPLAASVALPTPASPFANRRWVIPVAPPSSIPPPLQRPAFTPVRSTGAPTEAPAKIVPEVPTVAETPPPGAFDGVLGDSTGVPDASSVPGPVAVPPPPVPHPADRLPIKIGGSIRAPKRIAASAPIYPAMATSARVEGQVVLEALIDEQGKVGRVQVLKSVPLLDTAAVDAVRTWRYTPTLLNGVPVSVLMTVTVTFSLQR